MWKFGNLCLEERCQFRNVVLVLLLLLLVACKTEKCSIGDPIPVLHRYFQPGDLIVGGVTSQFLMVLTKNDFDQHPRQSQIGENL